MHLVEEVAGRVQGIHCLAIDPHGLGRASAVQGLPRNHYGRSGGQGRRVGDPLWVVIFPGEPEFVRG